MAKNTPPTPTLMNSKEVGVSNRYDDIYTDYQAKNIYSAERKGQSFLFEFQNNVALKIDVLTDTIFRVRYAPKGQFEDGFSYAISDDFKAAKVQLQFEEKDKDYRIISSQIQCWIDKKKGTLKFKDAKGKTINEDAEGYSARSTIHKGFCRIAVSKKSPKKEQYFGLGDKSCSLDLRGHDCDNYNTDAFAYGNGSYTLYRSIPFYYGLNNGVGYGIFMDNSHRSHFEFDVKKSGVTTFWAEGGEMNYYFIYGPKLMQVAQQYHQLTGVTELPPMWALGFHQCRWSYYPDARVRELANDFRKHQIPCDAIYLDIDYMDGFRCFTVNKKLFPDLKKLTSDLKKDGFSTIVMIDPGIKEDPEYWVYKDGIKNDVFCRRTNGDLMVGPVWPEECVFPDYTSPKARKWWSKLYKGLYGKDGVAGFWNDMNEPAVFKVNSKTFPDEVHHDYEGKGANHKRIHNVYGMQMTRATKDGLLKIKSKKRPFVLTRATYSGGQRYAAVWTGDNVATWEHLEIANRQCQRLSISGYSLVGSDVGGFVEQPTGELMARWIQLAIFHPLFRIHSMGNNADGSGAVLDNIMELDAEDRKDQEPWSYGKKFTAVNRKSIELRYQLLPYIYTAFYQQATEGLPVIRSLHFYDQKDEKLRKVERDFMFGDHLLVSPIVREKAKSQSVYLPEGQWFNFWTNKLHEGKKSARVSAKIDKIPFFVKAGTVLPLYPVRQHTKEKISHLDLHIYIGNGESCLYEDAGNGFEYRDGAYRKVQFVAALKGNKYTLHAKATGKFKVSYKKINLHFHTGNQVFKSLKIDGKKVDFETTENGTIQVSMKKLFKGLELK